MVLSLRAKPIILKYVFAVVDRLLSAFPGILPGKALLFLQANNRCLRRESDEDNRKSNNKAHFCSENGRRGIVKSTNQFILFRK